MVRALECAQGSLYSDDNKKMLGYTAGCLVVAIDIDKGRKDTYMLNIGTGTYLCMDIRNWQSAVDAVWNYLQTHHPGERVDALLVTLSCKNISPANRTERNDEWQMTVDDDVDMLLGAIRFHNALTIKQGFKPLILFENVPAMRYVKTSVDGRYGGKSVMEVCRDALLSISGVALNCLLLQQQGLLEFYPSESGEDEEEVIDDLKKRRSARYAHMPRPCYAEPETTDSESESEADADAPLMKRMKAIASPRSPIHC